jgi:preprotein translocase subunit SecF
MNRISAVGQKLYRGEVSMNIIGRSKTWYMVAAVLLLISIAALLIRGLNFGIEFKGGADFSVPNATCSVSQARDVAETATGGQSIVTQSATGTVRVQTEPLSVDASTELARELAAVCGVAYEEIKIQVVGPTWGAEISSKALQGLVVFLILVAIFLSLYFEWRMAVAALVALAHDLIITVGIYALVGIEVTPATVIGLLTILGYSLYDTVVVFDKVKENTRGIAGQSVLTYDEAANLALNQTFVRSINTSVVALLPILAIIIVGAGLLGAGTLLDLSVVLLIGMTVGTFSSLFVATPVLVDLKHRQPEIKALAGRVKARRNQAARARTGEELAEGATEVAVEVTTLTESAPRVQPKRKPRSQR